MARLFPPRRKDSRLQRTLRVRGDVMHTFGTLLTPLAIALVALGFYLLGSAFSHPLTTDAGVLIAASFLLSLGFVLLSYLLRSLVTGRPSWRAVRRQPSLNEDLPPPPQIPAFQKEPEPPLPFHRIYVDSARVRR
jgi:hypothetical protein